MEILQYISYILCIVFIILYICERVKIKKQAQSYDERIKAQKDFSEKLQQQIQQLKGEEYTAEKKRLTETLLNELELLTSKRAMLDSEISNTKQTLEDIKFVIIDMENERNTLQQDIAELQQETTQKKDYIAALEQEIADLKQKQNIINDRILTDKKTQDQQDFYKIQISDAYQKDIAILNGIRNQLSKIDILDKLIYDNYIKKAADDMIKRVLGGKEPCGIYKITRLKTGEVYIGKSTNIKERWQQHCKSCFHCGTISHSKLHTTMEQDGIQNWTFELLEEVPKDKCTEREKYWISFFNSKECGLNERNG